MPKSTEINANTLGHRGAAYYAQQSKNYQSQLTPDQLKRREAQSRRSNVSRSTEDNQN